MRCLGWVLGRFPAICFVAAAACYSGDGTGPSEPAYYTLLQDAPCGAGAAADTVAQPGYAGGGPNAGAGFIDSTVPFDRPPRAVLWVLGTSRATGVFTELTFILAHTPLPLALGTHPVRALADSMAWLEDYAAPYPGAGFPTDMNTARVSGADFIVEPIVGSIVVEESGATGAEGTFSIAGRYRSGGVVRCLRASGRFSTRP